MDENTKSANAENNRSDENFKKTQDEVNFTNKKPEPDLKKVMENEVLDI